MLGIIQSGFSGADLQDFSQVNHSDPIGKIGSCGEKDIPII
jgi:hypothetical protein